MKYALRRTEMKIIKFLKFNRINTISNKIFKGKIKFHFILPLEITIVYTELHKLGKNPLIYKLKKSFLSFVMSYKVLLYVKSFEHKLSNITLLYNISDTFFIKTLFLRVCFGSRLFSLVNFIPVVQLNYRIYR